MVLYTYSSFTTKIGTAHPPTTTKSAPSDLFSSGRTADIEKLKKPTTLEETANVLEAEETVIDSTNTRNSLGSFFRTKKAKRRNRTKLASENRCMYTFTFQADW